MTELQAKLLNILKAFDKICRAHDIEYFLTGGSALGAIRHHGFIPWDDDIDLGMTRSMWNKLRPVIEDELPEGLVMVDFINHPTYRNPIAKIIDVNSTVLYRANLADECPKGQYIEIFTHVPVPAEHLEEHKRKFLTYCELMTPYFSVFHEKMNYKKGLRDDELSIINDYYQAKQRAETEGREKVLAELDKDVCKYEYDSSDYQLLEWGVNTCYYPLENFGGVRYVRFEDMEVPVARRACDNLRIDYGNSWTDYPPLSQQVAHVTVGDENIDGEEYMKLIRKQADLEKTRAMRLSQKEINLKALPERVAYNKEIFAMQMKHAKLVAARSSDLGDLYAQGRYEEIAERFNDYILLKKRLRNYDFSEDIPEETREIIAKAMVMTGRTTQAEDVLDMPRNLFISDKNSPLVNDILRITKANSCFYDGMPDEAEALLEAVGSEMKGALLYRKIAARLALAAGKPAPDAEAMAEQFPDDLEVIKILADARAAQGKKDEAERLYDIVLEKSFNGMDILDIKEKRA